MVADPWASYPFASLRRDQGAYDLGLDVALFLL